MTAQSSVPQSSVGAEAEPLLGFSSRGIDAEDSPALPSNDAALYPTVEREEDGITLRIAAATWSFAVVGLFTSTTGVMIPHLQRHYQLTDIHVSAIFLVIPVGYTVASRLNDLIHTKLGQRGIAIIGPLCHLIYALTAGLRPPFAVILAAAGVGAFGIGLIDGSWCAWVAALPKANSLSGLLHGAFSVGAAVCPYLAGIMLAASSDLWYRFFHVLAAASVLELLILAWAFRRENAKRYSDSKLQQETSNDPNKKWAMFQYGATWVYAAYLLAYVGTECTISGWIVSFMLRIRHASTYASNICSSAFWAGMAVGRLMLGVVTDKIGLRRAVVAYLTVAPVFVVLFIFIRVLWFSVFTMALLGFVMGPLFPSCIVQLVILLPKELHVDAVSFVSSLGQVGGALLPYMLGAITQIAGLQAFQYMLLVQFAVLLVIWISSFKISVTKKPGMDEGRGLGDHED